MASAVSIVRREGRRRRPSAGWVRGVGQRWAPHRQGRSPTRTLTRTHAHPHARSPARTLTRMAANALINTHTKRRCRAAGRQWRVRAGLPSSATVARLGRVAKLGCQV
eukprot:4867165-Prymnesium_polylepis.1